MRSIDALLLGAVLALAGSPVSAADQDAVTKDRMAIAGTWDVVGLQINGEEADRSNAPKMSVINEKDGTWTVLADGKMLSKGSSTIDPAAKPKTIDFTVNEGNGIGQSFRGIYELKKNRRRLCFASIDYDRPTDFITSKDDHRIAVRFQRRISAKAGEKEVAFSSVPAKVKAGILAALHQNLDGFTIGDVEVEVEDGKKVFDVELVVDGQRYEVELNANGEVLEWELDDEVDDGDEGKDDR